MIIKEMFCDALSRQIKGLMNLSVEKYGYIYRKANVHSLGEGGNPQIENCALMGKTQKNNLSFCSYLGRYSSKTLTYKGNILVMRGKYINKAVSDTKSHNVFDPGTCNVAQVATSRERHIEVERTQ